MALVVLAAVFETLDTVGFTGFCEYAPEGLEPAGLFTTCAGTSVGLTGLFARSVAGAAVTGFDSMPITSGERSVFTFRNPTIRIMPGFTSSLLILFHFSRLVTGTSL